MIRSSCYVVVHALTHCMVPSGTSSTKRRQLLSNHSAIGGADGSATDLCANDLAKSMARLCAVPGESPFNGNAILSGSLVDNLQSESLPKMPSMPAEEPVGDPESSPCEQKREQKRKTTKLLNDVDKSCNLEC